MGKKTGYFILANEILGLKSRFGKIFGGQRFCIGRFLGQKNSLFNHRPAMLFGNRKIILEDLFCSVLSQFKKYHPSVNLKFGYLGIFQTLKLRILMEKNPLNLS